LKCTQAHPFKTTSPQKSPVQKYKPRDNIIGILLVMVFTLCRIKDETGLDFQLPNLHYVKYSSRNGGLRSKNVAVAFPYMHVSAFLGNALTT